MKHDHQDSQTSLKTPTQRRRKSIDREALALALKRNIKRRKIAAQTQRQPLNTEELSQQDAVDLPKKYFLSVSHDNTHVRRDKQSVAIYFYLTLN